MKRVYIENRELMVWECVSEIAEDGTPKTGEKCGKFTEEQIQKFVDWCDDKENWMISETI